MYIAQNFLDIQYYVFGSVLISFFKKRVIFNHLPDMRFQSRIKISVYTLINLTGWKGGGSAYRHRDLIGTDPIPRVARLTDIYQVAG